MKKTINSLMEVNENYHFSDIYQFYIKKRNASLVTLSLYSTKEKKDLESVNSTKKDNISELFEKWLVKYKDLTCKRVIIDSQFKNGELSVNIKIVFR